MLVGLSNERLILGDNPKAQNENRCGFHEKQWFCEKHCSFHEKHLKSGPGVS